MAADECCKTAQFFVDGVAKTEKICKKAENDLRKLNIFVIIITDVK